MWYILIHAAIITVVAMIIYAILKSRRKPNFEGKHVLITGGSSGIGERMAYIYSSLGAIVTLASNEPEEVTISHIIMAVAPKSEGELSISRQSLYSHC